MRFNKTQLNNYIDDQQAAKVAAISAVTSKSDGGGNNTAQTVRDALAASANVDTVTMKELKRQSFDVSPAEVLSTNYRPLQTRLIQRTILLT